MEPARRVRDLRTTYQRQKRIRRGDGTAARLRLDPLPVNNGVSEPAEQCPSYFPYELIETIFSYLPIKDATQASLVSRRFKNSWYSNRKLYFGRDFAGDRCRLECLQIVNRFFTLHRGPKIDCLHLYLDPLGLMRLVADWVELSIVKGVEELDLDFMEAGLPVQLPVDFSRIQTLKILRLSTCAFDLPPRPEGLKFLNTLLLKRISVTPLLVANIFKNCMHLETFAIVNCLEIEHLKVHARNHRSFRELKIACCFDLLHVHVDAPTLKSFFFCGEVITFRFIDVTRLDDVFLHFVQPRGFLHTCRIRNLVMDLCHVRVFTTTSTFLEGLTRRVVNGFFKDNSFYFWNLWEFQLIMEQPSFCNLYDIAQFLKKCPRLEKLYIDLRDYAFQSGFYYATHQRQHLERYFQNFSRLRLIRISGFKFHRSEIDMVSFFLRKATNLQKLVLVLPGDNRTKFKVPERRLAPAWNAMTNAQILIYEPNYGDSDHPTHAKQSHEF